MVARMKQAGAGFATEHLGLLAVGIREARVGFAADEL